MNTRVGGFLPKPVNLTALRNASALCTQECQEGEDIIRETQRSIDAAIAARRQIESILHVGTMPMLELGIEKMFHKIGWARKQGLYVTARRIHEGWYELLVLQEINPNPPELSKSEEISLRYRNDEVQFVWEVAKDNNSSVGGYTDDLTEDKSLRRTTPYYNPQNTRIGGVFQILATATYNPETDEMSAPIRREGSISALFHQSLPINY